MLGAASRNRVVASRRHSPTLAWTLRCLPYPGPISTVSCRTNWRSAWRGGIPPPLGLLQVAETLGGVDWQPARMDFGETLARLIAEIPEAMRGGTAVETALRKSGELVDLEAVAQSWFEDGPDIAQAIAGARARNRAKVATYRLQSAI